jgi:hypothetical protein
MRSAYTYFHIPAQERGSQRAGSRLWTRDLVGMTGVQVS